MSTNRIIVDASILKVHGEAEALRVANDAQYGLSSAVFTRDKERGLPFALDLHAGMTHIDDSSVDDTVTGPFGGEKNSGIGRFGDEWIIHEFTLGACPRIHVCCDISPRFSQGLGLSAWTPRSARTIPINPHRHCWTDAKS
jgi:hypothetical protein